MMHTRVTSPRWLLFVCCLQIMCLFTAGVLAQSSTEGSQRTAAEEKPTHSTEHQDPIFLGNSNVQPNDMPARFNAAANIFKELHTALDVMQDKYFSLWLGKWTTAIDWTAAVMGTHLSATLSSFSRSLSPATLEAFEEKQNSDRDTQRLENDINKYFAQSVSYYFGEDHFSIRNQAYDDILWVVLGWLESIQFINGHSQRHYPPSLETTQKQEDWHARQFVPPFAHRARVFYELAEKGWDWRLCGGGMTWNPRLLPYKNAITNELFISASVAMYLNFPGDCNCSPFIHVETASSCWETYGAGEPSDILNGTERRRSTYDSTYLTNAINGYDWLANSGMKNAQGLYVDGFHIKDYANNHNNTKCNERNEMVYTYNQGVVLSGLRGLWEATGNTTYLEDAHELVRNVVLATGWETASTGASKTFNSQNIRRIREDRPLGPTESWAGLGAHGILNELCDPSGTCTQDGQTFKGIFFHHLTALCTRLPTTPVEPGKTHAASKLVAQLHYNSCVQYAPWVVHNAKAALRTRDHEGRFGMWWGADAETESSISKKSKDHLPSPHAIDYRNDPALLARFSSNDQEEATLSELRTPSKMSSKVHADLNDRGRGRTVETQGGGLAVVRAMWEFLKLQDENASEI